MNGITYLISLLKMSLIGRMLDEFTHPTVGLATGKRTVTASDCDFFLEYLNISAACCSLLAQQIDCNHQA
jgi:hypothetical protein